MPLDPRAIIANGENAKTEFKRDDRNLRPEHLAREIVAFANMNGGVIVLGVEDDGAVSGVTRNNLQAWLMDTVIGRYVDPQIVPDYEEFVLNGNQIAIVTVPAGSAKPYAVRQQERTDYYIRLGDTVQRAGREQMARLFQSGGLVSVEKMPVHGSSVADLDMRRLEDYFLNVLGEDEVQDWQRTLLNRELLVADEWRPEVRNCSYAGIALFAREPRSRMPQAGIRLLVFPGTDVDYDANLDEVLDLPFVGLKERREREFVEQSLPSRVLSYLQPHISRERLEGMQRRRHWGLPYGSDPRASGKRLRAPRLDASHRRAAHRIRRPPRSDQPGAPCPTASRWKRPKRVCASRGTPTSSTSARLRLHGAPRHGNPPKGHSPHPSPQRHRPPIRRHRRLLQGHPPEGAQPVGESR